MPETNQVKTRHLRDAAHLHFEGEKLSDIFQVIAEFLKEQEQIEQNAWDADTAPNAHPDWIGTLVDSVKVTYGDSENPSLFSVSVFLP